MKHPFGIKDLYDFMESMDFPAGKQQKENFENYLSLLNKWARKQNLVSKNDIPHLVERHFIPSLFLHSCLPPVTEGCVLDIGSGAGFPGIPLKIVRPDLSITLLDSSRKKVLFLQEVCELLDLDCQVVCNRCENHQKQYSGQYQYVISRAVARLRILWGWAGSLLEDSGSFYALKGGECQEEINEMSDDKIKIKVEKPDTRWLKKWKYLENKYVVKMEN